MLPNMIACCSLAATPLYRRLRVRNVSKLAAVVLCVSLVSLAPFLPHLPQLARRLFPWGRGLCHAYWAPNVWVLYNLADKCLAACTRLLHTSGVFGGGGSGGVAVMTGGLVQQEEHIFLPTVRPLHTALATVLTMLVCFIGVAFYKLKRTVDINN